MDPEDLREVISSYQKVRCRDRAAVRRVRCEVQGVQDAAYSTLLRVRSEVHATVSSSISAIKATALDLAEWVPA
jgi:hypothetical protein